MSDRSTLLSPFIVRKLTFLLTLCLRQSSAQLGRNRAGEGSHYRGVLRPTGTGQERKGELKSKVLRKDSWKLISSSGREACLCPGVLQEVGHRLPHRLAGKPFA